MTIRLLSMGVVLSLVSVVGAAEEKLSEDAQKMQGAWEWDPNHSQSTAEPVITLAKMTIKGDKLTFHYAFEGQQFISTCTFKLKPGVAPKEIDFIPADGANKGKTYLGLYEFEGAKLKICYRGPGLTRPTGFMDAAEGNNSTTFIHLQPSTAKK